MKKFGLIIIVAILIGGCSQSGRDKLIIGIIKPSLNHLPLKFGFNIGTLNKEDYKIKYFNSGWETNEALVAEKIDVAIMPFTYTWIDVANGKKVKIISFLERESDGIIATKEYNELSDLRGKKIGVLRASTLDVFAEMISEKYELEFEFIYFRTPMDMAAALKAGEVEALSFYVPSIFKFTEEFHIIYWYGNDYPSHTCCNISATETAINTKYDKIEKFLSGMLESTSVINSSPAVAYEAVKEFYGLPIKFAKQSLYHTKYIMGLNEEKQQFEAQAINIMLKKGYIDQMVKPEDVYFEKK